MRRKHERWSPSPALFSIIIYIYFYRKSEVIFCFFFRCHLRHYDVSVFNFFTILTAPGTPDSVTVNIFLKYYHFALQTYKSFRKKYNATITFTTVCVIAIYLKHHVRGCNRTIASKHDQPLSSPHYRTNKGLYYRTHS